MANMARQMLLPLDIDEQERWSRLWRELPEQIRIERAALHARAIAEAARVAQPARKEEPGHEANQR